jgi:hypothetical protein
MISHEEEKRDLGGQLMTLYARTQDAKEGKMSRPRQDHGRTAAALREGQLWRDKDR